MTKTRYMELEEQISITKKANHDIGERLRKEQEYSAALRSGDLEFIKKELQRKHPVCADFFALGTIEYLVISNNQNLDRECFDIITRADDRRIASSLLKNPAIPVEWKCELIHRYKCL